MSITIRLRGATAAEWSAADPVLAAREVGLDLSNMNFRVGDGASAWSALAEWIAGGAVNCAIIQDEKPTGTISGTFTSGAWRTRDLNTIAHDDIGVTLNANQFVLPAGKYAIFAVAPSYETKRHVARIYSITDSQETIVGAAFAHNQNGVQNHALVIGVVDIADTKTFELQHQCEVSASTHGFGVFGNMASKEVFARVVILEI